MADVNFDLITENTVWTPSEDTKKKIWNEKMTEMDKAHMEEDVEYVIF